MILTLKTTTSKSKKRKIKDENLSESVTGAFIAIKKWNIFEKNYLRRVLNFEALDICIQKGKIK